MFNPFQGSQALTALVNSVLVEHRIPPHPRGGSAAASGGLRSCCNGPQEAPGNAWQEAHGSDNSRTGRKEMLYLGAEPDRRRPPQRRGVSGRLSAGGRVFVMVTGQSVGRRVARKDFRRRQVIVQDRVIIEHLFSQASGTGSRRAVVRVPLQHTASSLAPSATESRDFNTETLLVPPRARARAPRRHQERARTRAHARRRTAFLLREPQEGLLCSLRSFPG